MKNKKNKLSKEEKIIETDLEKGEWIEASKEELKRLENNAKYSIATKRKEARISLRMSQIDVRLLKSEAEKEGLGYQTLINSILHKYITGQLVDQRMFLKTYKTLINSK